MEIKINGSEDGAYIATVKVSCGVNGELDNEDYETIGSIISVDYQLRAEAERKAGGSCVVDESIPHINIKRSDKNEFNILWEQAIALLNDYKSSPWLSCSMEDYFLAVAQNW